MGAEKTFRRIAGGDGDTPFEQFLQSAKSQAYREHEQIEPAAPIHHGITKQNFPRQDRRHKPLGEVAELIVVVSLPAEELADEFERIDLRVAIVRAQKENKTMNQNERIEQRC